MQKSEKSTPGKACFRMDKEVFKCNGHKLHKNIHNRQTSSRSAAELTEFFMIAHTLGEVIGEKIENEWLNGTSKAPSLQCLSAALFNLDCALSFKICQKM